MFVGVLLFVYFSCGKSGKKIWKKYCLHVISNFLATVPSVGLLTISRQGVGETQLQLTRRERGKEILI